MFLGDRLHQLVPVLRQQILIRSDHLLAGSHGFQQIGSRRLDASHQLDHNLNLRIVHDGLPVVRKELIRDAFPVLRGIPHKDPADLHIRSRLVWELILLALYQLIYTAAHGSRA